MAQASDPLTLLRGRLEHLGPQLVREQHRDGKIPIENQGFILSWLAEKDREAARLDAEAAGRATAAAERAATAAEQQARVAQRALTTAIVANVIALIALLASAVSLFHIFK
jgi:hypothetical protein